MAAAALACPGSLPPSIQLILERRRRTSRATSTLLATIDDTLEFEQRVAELDALILEEPSVPPPPSRYTGPFAAIHAAIIDLLKEQIRHYRSRSFYSQPFQLAYASRQPDQSQSQAHHFYGQHGLPIYSDQVQSQQQHRDTTPGQPAQGRNLGGSSSYFRQLEAPYFHSLTPPVGQSQDSPYGAFGQLGQVQHQGQAPHLSNCSGADYGYGENQRNFYDPYPGASGFGNRNVLHDDYPSYPQNQYYGSPYSSGYPVPQPFVKYPTVFQGPPGPQSAPSPAGQQGPRSLQLQSPCTQSLYGQQPPSNMYDDIGYQQHQQHHSGGVGGNVGGSAQSSYYCDKHRHSSLYGSTQDMQGFMGLGQSGDGPNAGLSVSGVPSETAYKPYGGNVDVCVEDVSGAGASQDGVGQGPLGQAGVQPNQGCFYAQCLDASQAGGPQGQQSQQPPGQDPQGHQGFSQGGSDGSTFYSDQPLQQQGCWQ